MFRNRKRALLFLLTATTAAILMSQACSNYGQVPGGSDGVSSLSTITLVPTFQTITPGATVQFAAIGGVTPYTYVVSNGAGTMSPTGLYTAPPSVSGNSQAITITASDSAGNSSSATLNILPNGSAMTVTFSPNPVTPGAAVSLTVTGGVPPYKYVLISGGGQMSGSTYLSPVSSETASIQVTDSGGQVVNLAIPIGTGQVVSSIGLSGIGNHVPGGGGCPGGTVQVGAVADADDSGYVYGDQIFCSELVPLSAGMQVVTAIVVTQGGSHVGGGIGCPSGYTTAGQVEDCQGGGCGGQQRVCARFEVASTNTLALSDFYVTPSNMHSVNPPACNPGYSNVGVSADCGFGTCYGLQSYCTR